MSYFISTSILYETNIHLVVLYTQGPRDGDIISHAPDARFPVTVALRSPYTTTLLCRRVLDVPHRPFDSNVLARRSKKGPNRPMLYQDLRYRIADVKDSRQMKKRIPPNYFKPWLTFQSLFNDSYMLYRTLTQGAKVAIVQLYDHYSTTWIVQPQPGGPWGPPITMHIEHIVAVLLLHRHQI